MAEGWIKLHRKLLDWEWYDEPNVLRLFVHMLLKSNHTATKYRGAVVPAGSLVYGHNAASEQLKLSVQQIRTAFNKLKSTGEITSINYAKFSVVALVEWSDHQHEQQANQQADNSDVTGNQQASNSTQECKNERTLSNIEENENDKSKPKRKKNGTRIAETWIPTDKDREYARSKGFSEPQIDELAESFRGHWLQTTKNATSRDWGLKWQNGVRLDIKWNGPPSERNSYSSRDDELNRAFPNRSKKAGWMENEPSDSFGPIIEHGEE